MPNLLLVMAGGAIGAGLRYCVSLLGPRLGSDFPWATFIVNLSGGVGAGVLLGLLMSGGSEGEPWRLFLGVGMLGGFTTFSAFSAETFQMVQQGQLGLAALYILASVFGALVFLFAGYWLAKVAT